MHPSSGRPNEKTNKMYCNVRDESGVRERGEPKVEPLGRGVGFRAEERANLLYGLQNDPHIGVLHGAARIMLSESGINHKQEVKINQNRN